HAEGGRWRINHYQWERIVAGGGEERRDLIILPDWVVRNWWRRGGLPGTALADEGPLGTHHAELVALGVGEHGPGLGAGLPDVHPPGTKRKETLDLGLLLARIGAQVEVEAVLGRLDVGHGQEADAHRRGRVGADDDLPLPLGEDPPTQHLRPEP